MKILLGTTSKYKRALFNKLGLEYEVANPNFNEKLFLQENPDLIPIQYSEVLAKKKAMSLAKDHTDMLIIGSDQVCLMGNEVFHKSGDYEGALKTLLKLNGKTHQLYTSYYIYSCEKTTQYTNVTNLTMHDLEIEEIKRYIKLDQPYDCAGSYKLESYGATLFKKIETEDHHCIIGLPLLNLAKDLRALGITNFLGTHYE